MTVVQFPCNILASSGAVRTGGQRGRLLEICSEVQQNAVADEVSALLAVVRPILQGILMSLKHELVSDLGGYPEIRLRMLARARRPGDGDTGICSRTRSTTQSPEVNQS